MNTPRDPARLAEPSALQLVEEAVHLLRSAPVATLAIYLMGAAPWVLGFLFFWAHTTWFAPSGETMAWTSLGLVALFVWLKVAQAEFCARLLAQRLGTEAPVWSWRRVARLVVVQLPAQAWGLVALPVALIATVPAGWAYGYFQHVTVGGAGAGLSAGAREQAMRWPRQNHLGLLIISLFALVVWVNFASGFYAIPWLANHLLGIENVLGLHGWWGFNTTFLASVSALTWVAVDPLVKAFYVLRDFHGRALRTGEDIRVDIVGAQRRRRALAAGAVVAVSLAWLGGFAPARMWAADTGGAVAARAVEPLVEPAPVAGGARAGINPVSLDRALDEVLTRQDFQWQLRPKKGAAAKTQEGPVVRFLRQGVEIAKEVVRSIGRLKDRIVEWFDEKFGSKDKAKKDDGSRGRGWDGGDLGWLRIFLYALIAVAVGLIGWVFFLMWRQGKRQAAGALVARAVSVATPDLRDENVQASQMPADGWLALAREQMARGEWRLALRALYLATLARLAAEGLLALAKFKTNLDYERELRRRAVVRPELAERFAGRRKDFESVWYGRTEPSETAVRAWLGEMEQAAPPPLS